uniref:Uncharacterized protein n=1 Tax=Molossus molossus TaxID=27622 RepID=A0A7J8GKX1_MOLMO|nr:hypothetical protein HJG59_011423 [Molossus molossus]
MHFARRRSGDDCTFAKTRWKIQPLVSAPLPESQDASVLWEPQQEKWSRYVPLYEPSVRNSLLGNAFPNGFRTAVAACTPESKCAGEHPLVAAMSEPVRDERRLLRAGDFSFGPGVGTFWIPILRERTTLCSM